MTIATGDSVRLEYTARFPDGPVFDTTRERVAEEAGLAEHQPDREYEPLTVEIGAGEIIEGVDDALVGMEATDEVTVTIPPEKAYGARSEDLVQEHDATEFEQVFDGGSPEEGMQIRTQEGEIGEITHVDPEIVRLDFNHQLAGETLEFDLEVLEVD